MNIGSSSIFHLNIIKYTIFIYIKNALGIKYLLLYIKGLLHEYYTITVLERDRCEVLWSRVQQYWMRRSRVQYCCKYCCTLLHKTSYWSSSSVVIVLLPTALFYFNFEILKLFENFIILNFYEIIWNFLKFWNFMKILNFENFFRNFQIQK
jgi:hypothetical protein